MVQVVSTVYLINVTTSNDPAWTRSCLAKGRLENPHRSGGKKIMNLLSSLIIHQRKIYYSRELCDTNSQVPVHLRPGQSLATHPSPDDHGYHNRRAMHAIQCSGDSAADNYLIPNTNNITNTITMGYDDMTIPTECQLLPRNRSIRWQHPILLHGTAWWDRHDGR